MTPPPTLPIEYLLNNVVVDSNSHALEEHPDTAPIVHQCMAQKGAYLTFQIQKNKRYLRTCIIDESATVIGFQIVDIIDKKAREITAYIKEDITNIRQLLDYAGKRGYIRFKGDL